MLDRNDILELLLEPYHSLGDEVIAQAEKLAITDPAIAQALRECRTMSGLTSDKVFESSAMTDAVFLSSVRERIERGTRPQPARGVFGSARLLAISATVCVLIMAIVIGHGTWTTPPQTMTSDFETSDEQFASALEPVGLIEYDSLVAVSLPPESLAVLLGLPDMAEKWDFSENSDGPLSDELLSLDPQDLEDVLIRLEEMEFF